MKNDFPLVSVILATKNEGKNIERCLESLSKQSYPKRYTEIILVDNRSKDKTVKLARKYHVACYALPKHLSKKMNPRGAQINYGFSKSSGSVVFFPDADMTFDRDLLKEAVERMDQGADALYLPEVIVGRGMLGRIRNFERSFYTKTAIDAIRFVKRDIFVKVKGFDSDNLQFGPDDWDFTKRVKQVTAHIGITRNRKFHHEEQLSFKAYISKKTRYSASFESYVKKWGDKDPDVQKQLGFYYRYVGVFTENGQWKRLVEKPILTLGLYVLRGCIGLGYLLKRVSSKS